MAAPDEGRAVLLAGRHGGQPAPIHRRRRARLLRERRDPEARRHGNARARGFKKIFFAYADCGTGGDIDRLCEREGISRIAGPHCYSFFSGNDAFEAKADEDLLSFFLTDFLARQFEAFVIEPLGLDRYPQLKDTYFGNYRKLVYLSQEADATLQGKAKAAADYLGLAYEYRFTGYGDLTPSLQTL